MGGPIKGLCSALSISRCDLHDGARSDRVFEVQARVFKIPLQMLSDFCGFGFNYFDFGNVGYERMDKEVSADNSMLMHNIRRQELACGHLPCFFAAGRHLGAKLSDEGGSRRWCSTTSYLP